MENLDNIIWAAVGMVALVALIVLVAKGFVKSLNFHAGPIGGEVNMETLHEDIKAMKEAVAVITTEVKNGKPTTLVERVDRIEVNQTETHRLLKWQNDTLTKIAHHVGFIPDASEQLIPAGETQGVHTT